MIRGRHLALLALLLALASCGGERPPPERPEPAPPPAPAPTPDEPENGRARLSEEALFCRAVTRIVDAEASGYSALRGEPRGSRRWEGSVVPPGMTACEIEGRSHPGAEYVCRGETLHGRNAELLLPAFERTGRLLDACFERATWFPRVWERGKVFTFALGERQQMWRDVASYPKPAVTLKIEEDFDAGNFLIRLAFITLR